EASCDEGSRLLLGRDSTAAESITRQDQGASREVGRQSGDRGGEEDGVVSARGNVARRLRQDRAVPVTKVTPSHRPKKTVQSESTVSDGLKKRRSDHYSPQGYLRGFIHPSRTNHPRPLWVFYLRNKEWRQQSTSQVGARRG